MEPMNRFEKYRMVPLKTDLSNEPVPPSVLKKAVKRGFSRKELRQ